MKTIKKSLIYLIGLLLLTLGVIFSMRSGIGLMLMYALPYTFSLITKTEFAYWCFIFFAVMICLQPVFKIKFSKLQIIVQMLTALAFSLLIGFLNKLLYVIHPYDQYTVCLTYSLFSLFFTSLGLAHLRLVGFADGFLPEDFFEKLAEKKKISLFYVKSIFYISVIIISIILSLMFTKQLASLREGTLILLIGVYPLTRYFYNLFKDVIERFIEKPSEEEEKQEPVFIPNSVAALNEADISDIIRSIDVSDIKKPENLEQ